MEETVWADMRRFLFNPREVLEQLRAQMGSEMMGQQNSKRAAPI
jgi:hypothetical protein